MDIKWRIAILAALANDTLDILGIGSTPIIGNILDLLTSGLIYFLTGEKKTLPALIELLPFVDILPTYTAAVLWAYQNQEN